MTWPYKSAPPAAVYLRDKLRDLVAARGTGKSGIDSLPETKTGTVIVDEDDTEASSSIFPSGSPAAPARAGRRADCVPVVQGFSS